MAKSIDKRRIKKRCFNGISSIVSNQKKTTFIMLFFLQIASKIPAEVDVLSKLPSFTEIVSKYGPFLGLILVLVIWNVISQGFWFKKLIKAKDEEIQRLTKREEELNKRLVKFMDMTMKKTK